MPSLQAALSEHENRKVTEEILSGKTAVYHTDGNAAKVPEYEPADDRAIGYDLSRFDQRPHVREVRRTEARETPSKRKKAAVRPQVSVMSLFLAAVATLLSGVLIYNYVQLTVLNDQIADSNSQYEELKNNGVLLKTQYESRYDLSEIEEYAQSKLGMTKMERSQIEYVEIGSPDTITCLTTGTSAGRASFMAVFTEKINTLLAFLSN
ncbi:MAG: hypothetical protein VB111_05120 [Clostridiaceae bacterium]|nr:hypothetical protein [Clostridiaceae bacterium]